MSVFFLLLIAYGFLGVVDRRYLEEGEGAGSREKLNERYKVGRRGRGAKVHACTPV